jgi:hypothetical protein
MKKPRPPVKPTEPYPPSEVATKTKSVEINWDIEGKSLAQIIEENFSDCDLNKVMICENYYNGWSLNYSYSEPNPNYDKALIKYNTKIAKYKENLKIYEEELKKYKEKLKLYQRIEEEAVENEERRLLEKLKKKYEQ